MASNGNDCAFLGSLNQDFYITHDGGIFLGVLGGEAVYSAAGAIVWSARSRVFSRVGSDFPGGWLDEISRAGIDVQGVRIVEEPLETRQFFVYTSPEVRSEVRPAPQFLRMNIPLPKELINFEPLARRRAEGEAYDPLSVRPDDVPASAGKIRGAHICPADYQCHSLLPARMRELGVSVVTIDPSKTYMEPGFLRAMPGLLNGVTAFLPNEEEARAFFRPATMDLWDMAEELCGMGCHFTVIKCGSGGSYAMDQGSGKRWIVPAYPAKVRDITGVGAAFCGGFLTGLADTGDLVDACLRGTVSASLTIEGHGALYAVGAHPGLASARLNALRPLVTRI